MGRRERGRLIAIWVVAAACVWGAPAIAAVPATTAPKSAAKAPQATDALPSGPGSLAGLWTAPGYKGSMRTPPRDRVYRAADGSWPPLLPAASELLEQRIALSEKGDPYQNTIMQCLPGGVPEMVFGSPYPVQIIESAGQVTFLYEMYNHFRVVHIGGRHPDDPDPTFMGHSIGHWQGDTLVVDTVGLTDRTLIDEVGIPHSDELHVIERYHRTDAATLEISLTLDDPRTFSKPWDAKVIYKAAKAGTELLEFICENNRSTRD